MRPKLHFVKVVGHSWFNGRPDFFERMPMPQDKPSSRRRFFTQSLSATSAALLYPALGGARVIAPASSSAPDIKPFELEEITISELQDGMKSGKFTAKSLVEKYGARIDEIDKTGPAVNAVIEKNPDAMAIAQDLDREFKAKGPRSRLHGIPILIKDNINTADRMMTTAGSLALVGSKPPKDSFRRNETARRRRGNSGKDQP